MLFQNVKVLAVNQNVDEKTSNPIDGRTTTLELTPLDAQKLALAQSTGGLIFTLRSAGSLDAAPAQRVVESELVSSATLSQSDEAQSALQRRVDDLEAKLSQAEASRTKPVVTEAIAPAPAEVTEDALPTTAQVTIYRGLQGSSYTVPLDANQ